MKNRKFNLKELKVQSFITTVQKNESETVKGGASDGPTYCQACDPGPIDIPTIDIPTINDSCFSFCADKCNDF